jgi:hypothetical protein
VEVDLPQQRRDRRAFIGGQVLLGQPASTFVAEQIRRCAARHEIAVQDRVDLVLAPGPLTDQTGPADHLTAQRVGRLVGQPHRGQVIRRQQLRQIAASTLSVLTFASAIARVLAGLDTTTRPARLANSVAIAQVFPVASNATSSAGPKPSAKTRSCSGVVATRPTCVTTPACQTAT